MKKPKAFTVRLTPAMFHGLSRAMVALDAEMEPLEMYEYKGQIKRDHTNASRAWNAINDAYYKVNS